MDSSDPLADAQPPPLGSSDGGEPPTDPILQALLWLCRHYGQTRSAASLLAGHTTDHPMTLAQAVQVIAGAGFSAGVVQREPRKVLSLLMPVVLLMKTGDAIILKGRLDAPDAPASSWLTRLRKGLGAAPAPRYEIVLPGPADEVCIVSEAELLAEYSGWSLMAMPRPQPQSQARGEVDDDESNPDHHWLWGTLRRYIPYYRSAMVAAFLSNILMLFTGFFTSVVYDRVIPNQAFVTLWSMAVGALLATMFDLAARQLRSHLLDLAGKKADVALGTILFRKALGVRMEHKPQSSGSFVHYLAQVEVVRDFSTSASLSALTDLPFIALFILMTWFVAGELVVVLLISVPLILAMSWGMQVTLRRFMTANVRQVADLHGVMVEAMEGLEDLRAAGAQNHFQQRYEEANAHAAKSSVSARALSNWVNNFAMISQQLVTLAMMVWGVHLIHDGKVTAGGLIGAVMFATRAIAPLSSVVSLATRYQGARAALRILNDLMAMPSEREEGKRYISRPEINGQMGLREVSFAYPKGKHEHAPTVLKGVNIQIQPGERIAVLGKIGSGKSTVLRLLGGLYQPTEGFVEIDGIDLRQIDPADFRCQVGFVSQEPRLFYGTLRDNVLMGRPHASHDELLAIAKQTGLDRMAAAHPMGYDLPVGEGGGLLSGGQRQLVALARCLVTRPRILLMDEPTSSMDAQAEVGFIQHLKEAVGDRTLIVVTHRPALLDLVSRIIVMDAGRVLADGPKAAVLAALSGQRPAAAPAAQPALAPNAAARQLEAAGA